MGSWEPHSTIWMPFSPFVMKDKGMSRMATLLPAEERGTQNGSFPMKPPASQRWNRYDPGFS